MVNIPPSQFCLYDKDDIGTRTIETVMLPITDILYKITTLDEPHVLSSSYESSYLQPTFCFYT